MKLSKTVTGTNTFTEDLLTRNKTKYRPRENRVDRTADTILNAVDGLAKRIKGTRAVYEVLCEFAHPNVGLILALTQSAEPFTDNNGVPWIRKEITLDTPTAAVQEMGRIWNYTFSNVAECLRHFEALLEEAKNEQSKIQRISQVVLRRIFENNPELVTPYASCPCDSGLKVKFCCGKA